MTHFNNLHRDDMLRDLDHSGGQPVRYNAVDVKLSLLQSLALFFRHGEWVRVRRDFVPVFHGDPSYDDACFEAILIYDMPVMDRIGKIHNQTNQ